MNINTDDIKNKIRIFAGNQVIELEGCYYIYREDFIKEGCVHYKDSEGKHHRIYGATVIIDEM